MVSGFKIKKDAVQLFFNTLPKDAILALKNCSKIDFFSRGKWYLAGGTALALQSGHRRSYDLDFFTENKSFDEKDVEKLLNEQGGWITNNISKGTVFGVFSKTKISLISYPFFIPAEKLRKFG